MNLSKNVGLRSLSKYLFRNISNNPNFLPSSSLYPKNINCITLKPVRHILITSVLKPKLVIPTILSSVEYVNNHEKKKLSSKSLGLHLRNFIGDSSTNTNLPTLNIDNYKSNMFTDIYKILENELFIQNQYIDPLLETNNNIQAARLIVIRRRKMKKHKLRKLRKKMKFEWAKVRQRREMRKEKAFQANLIAQIKEAEKFSAAQYVNDKLHQANTEPIPRYWKGRRLPQFIIKEKFNIK